MDDEQVFHEPEQRPNQSEEHKTCVGVHLLGVVSFFLFFFCLYLQHLSQSDPPHISSSSTPLRYRQRWSAVAFLSELRAGPVEPD